jgi:two-component system chemotaxis response regulator CheB
MSVGMVKPNPRLSGLAREPGPSADGRDAPSTERRARRAGGRIDVVAIGCSTGGANAITSVLTGLRGDFAVPILVTQHMPPRFTRLLARRLDRTCPLPVHEGRTGQIVERGHVYVAPGDFHMEARRDGARVRLLLHRGPPENSCRPSVDAMIRSVAAAYGPSVLGVILTGMGQDGLRGCELVRAGGGQVVVQDEASSVVWGMPGAVATAGLADAVVPLDEMATEIARRVMTGSRQFAAIRAAVGAR